MDIISNYPLHLHLSTHSLMQLPDLFREVALCSGWWLTQKLTTAQRTEKCQWSDQPQIGHLYLTHTQRDSERGGAIKRESVCSGIITEEGIDQRLGRTGIKQCILDRTSPSLLWTQFSVRQRSLISWPWPSGWPCIQEYVSRKNLSL